MPSIGHLKIIEACKADARGFTVKLSLQRHHGKVSGNK